MFMFSLNYGSDNYTVTLLLTIVVGLMALLLLVKKLILKSLPSPVNLGPKHHVVITGGSSGIGLSVAKLCYKKGATVTIIARSIPKLKVAAAEIEATCDDSKSKVNTLSLDLSGKFETTQKKVNELCKMHGAPTILFNIAGTSSAGKFVDTPVKEFLRLNDINYLGTVYTTKAFIPHMIKASTEKDSGVDTGRILLTSSAAGQIGVFGYSAYSPTKFALRGLAETLTAELACYGMGVTIAFPPDTDTPGFAEENLNKPEETRLISEAAGVFTPEAVAKKMVDSACKGEGLVYWGLEGWMLAMGGAGMCICDNVFDFFSQVMLNGLFRLIGLVVLADFRRIIRKVNSKAEKV